jgi:outer membrane murein-binding lipoprotein Lpp
VKKRVALASLLVLVAIPAAEGQPMSSAPSFAPARNYATGTGPNSVAMGDVNGDGKRDLATANSSANTVSVLLNRPGLCTVQNVSRETLQAAKRTIARANCRVGKIAARTRRGSRRAV